MESLIRPWGIRISKNTSLSDPEPRITPQIETDIKYYRGNNIIIDLSYHQAIIDLLGVIGCNKSIYRIIFENRGTVIYFPPNILKYLPRHISTVKFDGYSISICLNDLNQIKAKSVILSNIEIKNHKIPEFCNLNLNLTSLTISFSAKLKYYKYINLFSSNTLRNLSISIFPDSKNVLEKFPNSIFDPLATNTVLKSLSIGGHGYSNVIDNLAFAIEKSKVESFTCLYTETQLEFWLQNDRQTFPIYSDTFINHITRSKILKLYVRWLSNEQFLRLIESPIESIMTTSQKRILSPQIESAMKNNKHLYECPAIGYHFREQLHANKIKNWRIQHEQIIDLMLSLMHVKFQIPLYVMLHIYDLANCGKYHEHNHKKKIKLIYALRDSINLQFCR